MHRLRLHVLSILLLSALTPWYLSAETLSARVVVPEAQDLLEQRYNQVVADAVALSLRQFGFSTVENEADLEVRIESAPYPPRLHLSISAYDTASGSLVAGINGSGRTNVTLLNSVDALLDSLEGELERYIGYREGGNPYLPVPETRTLRFLNEENRPVTVTLATGEELLSTREPEAESEELTVALGSPVPLLISAPFSQAEERIVIIEDPQEPIRISDLPELERFGASLRYSLGKMVGGGLGGRWYPIPDRFFLAFESDFFLSGYGQPQTLAHSENRLLFGFRPGSPERRFRYSFSLGAGALFTLPGPEMSSYIDTYLAVGYLTLEYKLRRFVPFLRFGTNYVLPGDLNLLEEGVDTLFFNPALSLGVRYTW